MGKKTSTYMKNRIHQAYRIGYQQGKKDITPLGLKDYFKWIKSPW